MLRRSFLGIAVLVLASGTLLRAQDEVFIKGKSIKGKITKESPREITVGVKDVVQAVDILDIKYSPDPLTARLAYNAAYNVEKESLDPAKETTRKSLIADAIKKYEDVLPTIQTNFAKRHIEYKIAMLRVRQVQEDGEDPAKAIKSLTNFARTKANKSGWQINSALQTLGRLQVDASDFDGAIATYQQIADLALLPEDVRQDARLSGIQVKLQGGKYDEARSELKDLQKELQQGSRFFARAKVAEAECLVAETAKYKDRPKDDPARAKLFSDAVELVRGVIKSSNDKYVKAVGHNTLGYCYMEQGQTKDAVWEFLWVDVVYNQDRAQHAKALYYLWELFSKDGDAPRAQECREALLGTQFTGLEYQRKVKDAKTP